LGCQSIGLPISELAVTAQLSSKHPTDAVANQSLPPHILGCKVFGLPISELAVTAKLSSKHPTDAVANQSLPTHDAVPSLHSSVEQHADAAYVKMLSNYQQWKTAHPHP
jgi:hypothetical protein